MCGLEEDLDQVWRMIERSGMGGPEDASHWVRVYQELVATGESLLEDMKVRGDDRRTRDRLDRRVAMFRNRLRYWEAELSKSLGEPQP